MTIQLMSKTFYFSYDINITQRLTAGEEKKKHKHFYYWWGSFLLSSFSPALKNRWNVNLMAVNSE